MRIVPQTRRRTTKVSSNTDHDLWGECQALGHLAEQRSKEVRDFFLQYKIFEALDNGKGM